MLIDCWITSATAGSSARSGRSASLKRVVPTPSVWTPRYFASGFSIVGKTPKMPIEPVIVSGLAQISSEAVEIQ